MHYDYNVEQTSNRARAQVPIFEEQQDYALSPPKSLVVLLVRGLEKRQ